MEKNWGIFVVKKLFFCHFFGLYWDLVFPFSKFFGLWLNLD